MNDHDYSNHTAIAAFKRLVWVGALLGLIGGAVGAWVVIRYGGNLIPTDRKQVLVQESSAVTSVINQVSPSVVSITTESTSQDIFGFGQAQQQEGAGTGMILTSNGLILTNNHVVPEGSGSVTVFTSDGKEYKNAQVVARDTSSDFAFVKISASGLKPISLGDSKHLVVGQPVVAIGNALGQFQNTATQGIISGLGRPIVAGDTGSQSTESLQDLIQTDAAINPGNSGGPLVDIAGKVIGMNTAVAGNAQNIGFAIPIDEITSAINSVESQGKIVKPFLGVRYIPITKELAASENLPVDQGAYLKGGTGQDVVVSGSPAAKAGLQAGDIITKIDGTAIDQNNSLTAIISNHKVGDKVTLTVIRGGKTITLTTTLMTSP